ncbi:trifunctional UDP-glucose 4,6-dehydratase/UDP-4-keto-6-deoxy-D-glucose 3,5-epimerase/UDP-4-keto-L-rhamnose-reductase RHM1-like [Gossypium hirsutum]|uniref:Trifunctional UDP-glucose 4,6-dehydratase/UDP-4-keto-6-deoxy-D-glucose 3,5-epimerase/UDP-4-keto-L-rhamnose-reductase RHM1-like n=1 Tax=Gossypium hirsutum TaxID=3635 RepID=A0ABM2ZM99_GOSHI|nr:trifunctional UDP-glucose 4,6-dehydratase/UDP-4-keto-6-deoxy-D-glucose 3,5-epimerase/UDP-4-keto-L-rhamnose-reductase RHM1-like [Gossypium hirsutum]
MSAEEREKRHQHNFHHVTKHTAQEWAEMFVSELNDTVVEAQLRTSKEPPELPQNDAVERYLRLKWMFLRHTKGDWMTTMPEHLNMEWVDSLKHVFEYFTERTPRSEFEIRTTSLVWNYKYADVEFGRLQARDMLQHLDRPISNASVDVVQGSRSVEVRPVGVTKNWFHYVFLYPKNILITGAAGFIASHIANRLIRNYPDYKIVVLDKLDYCSNLKNLLPSKSSPNFKFVKGDIGSADLVNYLLITESIDTIMHFAAQTHVDNSRFIHVSTDEVYGETDEDAVVGNHEASQLLPTNPYSATKAGAEMLVMAYAMRGKTLPIHGDGSNVRSYLYCEDVAEAFEVILHKGEVGHVYNIGTKKERRVIDVAKDISEELGWSERTVWEEGLKKTIEWYTQNPEWWGDVSGALLPHPRMLMMPGGRHFDSEEGKGTSFESGPNQTRMVVPTFKTSSSTQKPALKFLIYGRTGWIGGLLGQLCEKQGIPFEYGRGRLEDRSSLMADIQNIKPTHVFNAAGVTGRPNVDWCESHKTETIRTNVAGTLTLADVCREHGLLMMNFATGCIFEYDAGHPEGSGIGYKEEDKPNFTGSFYSKTKAMVEELLKEYENVCTLRVRMPISSDLNNPRNFIAKIARYNKVVNIPNSMTILDELLPISIEMAKRNLKWVNFTLEEQAKVIVAPRSNNEMDASKLKNEFPDLLPIKDH